MKKPKVSEPTTPSAKANWYRDKRKLTYRVTEKAHQQLKVLAAQEGQTMTEILNRAVNDLFRAHNLPPTA